MMRTYTYKLHINTYKLLLSDGQVSNLRKAFMNNSSANIKSART